MVGSLISKSLNEVTFTTVLLCLVSLYERSTAAVVHGERYRGPFVRVMGIIGQQQCVRECRYRPKLCRGVNYQKQELLCDLVSVINETESKSDYVRIELDQAGHIPNECLSCSTDDLCVTLSSKKVHCIRALLGLALGKQTKQSSAYGAYGAEYAVDGNRGTHMYQDKCSSTRDGDTNPWWRVDLLTVYSIKSVRILNRGIGHDGDFSNRLRDVTATVGLTESDVNTPCGVFAGPGTASQLVVINCPTSPQGRFVKISKTTLFLTLCEVDVFGNDKLHHLLSQGTYEMRMDMEDFDNQTRYVKYSSFNVGDESTKYTVTLSGFSGDVDDCFTEELQPVNNMMFSTWNQDNDVTIHHCANQFKSGWWHNSCHCANPNGLYLWGENTQGARGITYKYWRSQSYSLKYVHLMVRRTD